MQGADKGEIKRSGIDGVGIDGRGTGEGETGEREIGQGETGHGEATGRGLQAPADGRELRIGIVQARFNAAITDQLAAQCRAELQALGVMPRHIKHVTVPGALEVAIALQAMAESENYDALVALGCIIRGETYHFELVANESGAAVTRLALDHEIPIANAILTVENEAQAWARTDEKGRDAARVAVEMANLMEALS